MGRSSRAPIIRENEKVRGPTSVSSDPPGCEQDRDVPRHTLHSQIQQEQDDVDPRYERPSSKRAIQKQGEQIAVQSPGDTVEYKADPKVPWRVELVRERRKEYDD